MNNKNKNTQTSKRMKDGSRLSAGEIFNNSRLANIAKAESLISKLKPLLRKIHEKEMQGEEPLDLLEAVKPLEAAFAEFRGEYLKLYEDFQSSNKKAQRDKWV